LVGVCSSVTRGHSLRLQKNRTKYDLCKFCFANRTVNIWNSLPSYVVSAETVNCFKTRLDRFWLLYNQDIIYNFRSDIHGTESRSKITVKEFHYSRHSSCVIESGKEVNTCACFLSTTTSTSTSVPKPRNWEGCGRKGIWHKNTLRCILSFLSVWLLQAS